MQLFFLRKSYEASNPVIEATETQETGKFLGHDYSKKNFNMAQRYQPSKELSFMGHRYTR